MLKAAVIGGQSLVFKCYYKVSVTKVRPHPLAKPKICKRILSYEAKVLYLSTMVRGMPCRKERVVHYWPDSAAAFTECLKAEMWFGFTEVDIKIPVPLWMKFEEMPLFFYTKQIPAEVMPQHMLQYLERTGRKRGHGKKLVGVLSAEKLLLYAPLLCWHIEHGAVIKAVNRTINYQATKIFTQFVEQVTEACCTGDTNKSKALLAVFKLLGNSMYEKMIEVVERQV